MVDCPWENPIHGLLKHLGIFKGLSGNFKSQLFKHHFLLVEKISCLSSTSKLQIILLKVSPLQLWTAQKPHHFSFKSFKFALKPICKPLSLSLSYNMHNIPSTYFSNHIIILDFAHVVWTLYIRLLKPSVRMEVVYILFTLHKHI